MRPGFLFVRLVYVRIVLHYSSCSSVQITIDYFPISLQIPLFVGVFFFLIDFTLRFKTIYVRKFVNAFVEEHLIAVNIDYVIDNN